MHVILPAKKEKTFTPAQARAMTGRYIDEQAKILAKNLAMKKTQATAVHA